VLTMILSFR